MEINFSSTNLAIPTLFHETIQYKLCTDIFTNLAPIKYKCRLTHEQHITYLAFINALHNNSSYNKIQQYFLHTYLSINLHNAHVSTSAHEAPAPVINVACTVVCRKQFTGAKAFALLVSRPQRCLMLACLTRWLPILVIIKVTPDALRP